MTQTKSCFNCKHVYTWHYPATREQPEESGWECNHPTLDWGDYHLQELKPDPECKNCLGVGFTFFLDTKKRHECDCRSEGNDEAVAKNWAENCSGYEFYDHDLVAEMAAQSEAASLAEQQMLETEQNLFAELIDHDLF